MLCCVEDRGAGHRERARGWEMGVGRSRLVHTDLSRAGVNSPVSPQGPSRSTNHFGSQTGGGRGKDQGPTFRYVACDPGPVGQGKEGALTL